MHNRLTDMAKERGVTLSTLVRRLVAAQLEGPTGAPIEEPIVPAPSTVGSTPRGLLREACDIAGIGLDEARSRARGMEVSQRRWHVMAILSEAGWSSVKIGNALGGRDHTTVLHGLGRWKEFNQERAA